MTRDEIDARVLERIRRGVHTRMTDDEFSSLALEVFRYQYAHDEPYHRLCAALGASPDRIDRWQAIPAVPTGAFKEARLATFSAERDVRVFRTSGSTTERRGTLHLDTLALYEASLLETFRAWICPDRDRIRLLVLAPSADEAPDSSLSYMFQHAMARLGSPSSDFLVHRDGWDPDAAIGTLADANEPLALVGTAFAFVHLVDALDERSRRVALPPGSRVMETGGFKGRSRVLERDALHDAIARALGIDRDRIVNQYGMCELGSQFYEPTLVVGHASTHKRVPPWVRTRIVDPHTRDEVPEGEVGVLVHHDLANTGSVLAVETSDLGRRRPDGFEVLGRLEGAEARGCSLAADALLADSA